MITSTSASKVRMQVQHKVYTAYIVVYFVPYLHLPLQYHVHVCVLGFVHLLAHTLVCICSRTCSYNMFLYMFLQVYPYTVIMHPLMPHRGSPSGPRVRSSPGALWSPWGSGAWGRGIYCIYGIYFLVFMVYGM